MNNENSNNILISTINKDSQLITKELIFAGNVFVNKYLNSVIVEIPNTAITTVGNPTGGVFGTYNPADLLASDLIADAFSKVSLYLEKLTPSPPLSLGNTIITLQDVSYSAYSAASPYTLRSNIVNNEFLKPSVITTPFGDAANGVLSAIVKNTSSPATQMGSVALTAGDNTGTFGDFLEIVSDTPVNPFFNQLIAKVGGMNVFGSFAPSNQEIYTMQLSHSLSGNTNVISFYQDDAFTNMPSALFPEITSMTGTIQQVSGINVYTSGMISGSVTAMNCVKKFYNSTWVGQMFGDAIATSFAMPVGADRNEGSMANLQFAAMINANDVFTTDLAVSFVVRNSAGVLSNIATGKSNSGKIYIDNVSTAASNSQFANESERNKSFAGIYPSPAIDLFDTSESLEYNYELQLIGGRYQYPPAINYSSFSPSSYDYSSLSSDGGYRYYTQLFDPVVDASHIQFTIFSPQNFAPETIDRNTIMQVAILGATGWLDINGIYSGTGTPINNGDAALDYALSTSAIKRVTFGGALYSGFVLFRLGLKSTSTSSFSGIGMIAT